MRATRNIPKKRKAPQRIGLAAIGSDGAWVIALDESTSGAHRWFAQIEGPSVFMSFRVRSPAVIGQMLEFLATDPAVRADGRRSPAGIDATLSTIRIGASREAPVTIVRDDEFFDRFFLMAETRNSMHVRVTIGGENLKSSVRALQQVQEGLGEIDGD